MFSISNCKSYCSAILARLVVILCVSVFSLNALAVSDAEMDQAKAIAAKWYLRYINSGADYLDKLNPKSMSELDAKLNPKEKENIKKFNAIAAPAGYASWTKDDLVKYWSSTFFDKNGSSLDKALGSADFVKSKVKGEVQKQVKVAANTSAATPDTPEVAPTAPSDSQEPAPDAVAEGEGQAAPQVETPAIVPITPEVAAAQPAPQKKSSGTWVYVMVLCILVAIVIVLVVYASKTMKGQTAATAPARTDEDDDDYRPRPKSSLSDDTKMREKFAETLAAKSEEIRTLNRKMADLESANQKLKEENRKLKSELEGARYQRPQRVETREPAPTPVVSAPVRPVRHKEIYLGRANAKGLFVRADRHAVEGQSIFKLKTADGVNGTFTVISNPLVEEQVLEDPGKWLAGGCFAKDIFDTDGRTSVITENPGAALFEDGAWRVERKAKIRYE